jgi:hypothetical protein
MRQVGDDDRAVGGGDLELGGLHLTLPEKDTAPLPVRVNRSVAVGPLQLDGQRRRRGLQEDRAGEVELVLGDRDGEHQVHRHVGLPARLGVFCPTPHDSQASARVPWLRETPPMVCVTPRSDRPSSLAISRARSVQPRAEISEEAPLAENGRCGAARRARRRRGDGAGARGDRQVAGDVQDDLGEDVRLAQLDHVPGGLARG